MVMQVVQELKRDKNMRERFSTVMIKKPLRDLLQTPKFIKPMADDNPFKRTLGDIRGSRFISTQTYLKQR
jgi:hypothetical protein